MCGCKGETEKGTEEVDRNNTSEFINVSLQDNVLQLNGKTVKLCTSVKSFLGEGWSVIYREDEEVKRNKTACEIVQNEYGDRMEVCGVNYEDQVRGFDKTTIYSVRIQKKTWGGELELQNGIVFGTTIEEVIKQYGNPVYFDHPYESKYFMQFLSNEADMITFEFSKDGLLDSVELGNKNYLPETEYSDETSVCKPLSNLEYRKFQYTYKFPQKKTELYQKVKNEKKFIFDGIEITDNTPVKEVIDSLNWQVEAIAVYDQATFIELRKGFYTFRIDFAGACEKLENLTDSYMIGEISIQYHPYDETTLDKEYYPSVILPGNVTADKVESVLKEYGLPDRYDILQNSQSAAESEDEQGTYGSIKYNINAFANYIMGFHKNGKINYWSIVFSDYDIHK